MVATLQIGPLSEGSQCCLEEHTSPIAASCSPCIELGSLISKLFVSTVHSAGASTAASSKQKAMSHCLIGSVEQKQPFSWSELRPMVSQAVHIRAYWKDKILVLSEESRYASQSEEEVRGIDRSVVERTDLHKNVTGYRWFISTGDRRFTEPALTKAPPAKPEAQKDLQESLIVTCKQQASDFVLSRSVCSQVSNLKVPRAQVTNFGKLLWADKDESHLRSPPVLTDVSLGYEKLQQIFARNEFWGHRNMWLRLYWRPRHVLFQPLNFVLSIKASSWQFEWTPISRTWKMM